MAFKIPGQIVGRRTVRWATRAFRCVAVVFAGGILAAALGCTTQPAPPPPLTLPTSYLVGAPDMLAVQVLPEPVIEYSVTVRPDGMITIPLVGDLPAGGRTVAAISADIEKRMGRYKKGARVTVSLISAASTDITVLGEVGSQSSFPLVKATRIIEVIGQVKGTTSFAQARKVRVIRIEDGRSVVHTVNVARIRNGDQSTNMLIQPGDIIYVPPTVLAKIGYAIQQLFFPFQPAFMALRMTGTW